MCTFVMKTAQNGLESFFLFYLNIYFCQGNDAELKILKNPSNLLLPHANSISQEQLLLPTISLCLGFLIQFLRNTYQPPSAHHGLCSYTDCTERGGRVNPPHLQLSPGPLPGLHCEWGDMELEL